MSDDKGRILKRCTKTKFGDQSSESGISEKELSFVEEKNGGRLEADGCNCGPEHAEDFLHLHACILVCRPVGSSKKGVVK